MTGESKKGKEKQRLQTKGKTFRTSPDRKRLSSKFGKERGSKGKIEYEAKKFSQRKRLPLKRR